MLFGVDPEVSLSVVSATVNPGLLAGSTLASITTSNSSASPTLSGGHAALFEIVGNELRNLEDIDALGSFNVSVDISNSRPASDSAAFSLIVEQAPSATLQVSVTGSDTTGNGTAGAPFRTGTVALTFALPGDHVALRPGVHDTIRAIEVKGTLERPITIGTLPGEEGQALIRGDLQQHAVNFGPGTAVRPEETRDGVYLDRCEHVHVFDLDIADCWRSGGFAVGQLSGGPNGVTFARNTVTRTGSSSIFVGGNNSTIMIGANESTPRITDVLIEDNDCSLSNVPTDWNTNGANSETITVAAGVDTVIVRRNWVHDSDQYGIDIKAGVRNFQVVFNVIEDIELFAIYLDGGRRVLEDGLVRGNIIRRCKNGVVLAREAATANGPGFAAEYAADPAEFDGMSIARIIIDSNSIFETEQSGIFFQRHPRDGPAGRILDIQAGFNTVGNANRECAGNPSATTFDLNLSGWFDADMRAANVAQNVKFFCNIVSNSTDAVRTQNTFTGQPGYTEARNFIGDAQFANLNAAPPVLRLVAGGPATSLSIASDLVGYETGIEGLTRIVGPIGAYSEVAI